MKTYTTKQVAEIVDRTVPVIRKWCKQGKLPAYQVKVRGCYQWQIDETDIPAYLRNHD